MQPVVHLPKLTFKVRATGRSPTILLFWDATPRTLFFGRLTDELLPVAKFAYWDKDRERYVMLGVDEFARRTGRNKHRFNKGTLELLATGMHVAFADEDGTDSGLSVKIMESFSISSVNGPQAAIRPRTSS